MARYLLRRMLYLAPIWLGVSFVTFALANLAPGDPARVVLQQQLLRQPTDAEVAAKREELGLDDPFVVRYGRWLGDAVTGDLGTSFRTGAPVGQELLSRVPKTLQLAVVGTLAAVAIALPLGVLAAVWRNSVVDHLSRALVLLGSSMPSFWVAYLLILVVAVHWGWLPVAGSTTWQHLVLPVATLVLAACASLTRLTRSEMLEVLGQDFVQTARAKGLGSRSVMLGHALRNALLPVMTVTGLRFGELLSGAVIVETIFAWPGIGKFTVDSIFFRDYPVVQGFVIFMGTVYLAVNLLVDLTYAWLDPRIRLGSRGG